MKVSKLKKLLEKCDDNLEVMICDDGMSADYFSIDFGAKSKFSRLIRKASTKKEKVQYVPPGPKGDCDNLPAAYCSKCKNYIEGSRTRSKSGYLSLISCNSREHGVLNNVIEYEGTQCCCYDPKEPLFIEKDVQTRAPVYKEEDILMLVTNLHNNKQRK